MDEILIKSLEVLEDGKILTINTKNNTVVYLQPVIVVDSKEEIQRLEVKGSDGNQVRVSTDIDTIDGVSFSGTFEQLETAIREAAKTANGLLNGGVSGGGGGGGDASATNQVLNIAKLEQIRQEQSTATKQDEANALLVDLEDNGKRKSIGRLIDLTADLQGNWGGFPVQAASMTLLINGDSLLFEMYDVESANNKDLVQQLNNVQKLVAFDWVEGSDEIVFNGVTVSNIEVQGLLIEDNNVGQLGYTNFVDSTSEDTGAVQQVALLMQQQLQLLKDIATKTPNLGQQISLSYTGSAIKNLTSSPDIDGKLIPLGSHGDIVSIQDLGAGNVNYRFDSGTPSDVYGTISGNRPFDKLVNVDFDTFRVKAQAGGADYVIIINLYK